MKKFLPAASAQLSRLCSEGLSSETIALTIAVGFVLGVFPILGCPTLLCAAAAMLLRLNFPAVQVVNYLVYPLQIALLVPFFRLGQRLFRASPPTSAIHLDVWKTAWNFCGAALHTVTAWFCVSLPLGILLYFVARFLLRQYRAEMFQWRGSQAEG